MSDQQTSRECGKGTEEDCERSLGLCGLPIITAIPIHNKAFVQIKMQPSKYLNELTMTTPAGW